MIELLQAWVHGPPEGILFESLLLTTILLLTGGMALVTTLRTPPGLED